MARAKLIQKMDINLDAIDFTPSPTELDALLAKLNHHCKAAYPREQISRLISTYRYTDLDLQLHPTTMDAEHTLKQVQEKANELQELLSEESLRTLYIELTCELQRRTDIESIEHLRSSLGKLSWAAYNVFQLDDRVITTAKENKLSTLRNFARRLREHTEIKLSKTRNGTFEKLCRELLFASRFEYKSYKVDTFLPDDMFEYISTALGDEPIP